MKKSYLLLSALLTPTVIFAQSAPTDRTLPAGAFRTEICLNGMWDFRCDTDEAWTQIRVPGCYSILQEGKWKKYLWDSFLYPKRWTEQGATYRRKLDAELPKDLKDKTVTFYCGASCFHTYVSLNDNPVGEFHDGFFPFEFALNRYVRKADNTLTVRVAADKELTFSGESSANRGITEDCFLKIYPQVFTDPKGVVIKTRVEKKQLETEVEIVNASKSKAKVFVRHFVTDRDGQTVQVFDGGWTEVAAGDTALNKGVFGWDNPHLWSQYDPYLYHLHTVLYSSDNKPFDKNTQRFGFREITVKSHHIYLNGEELFLRGHSGHYTGDLQGTREYAEKWLKEMLARGINFKRMHIYPRHRIYYEVADELGFLFESEAAYHFRVPAEEEVWKAHLGNLARAQRNHPSVLLWSVSNELRWQGGGEKKPLIDYMKGLDDTRPVFASDFSLESRHGDLVGHHYNAGSVFSEWQEFGADKPMVWDECGDVWQESRPVYSGPAGFEVSAQDWAVGIWRDAHDQIYNNIVGMVDGKVINGTLHRVNAYIPWDLSYIFVRWQPTDKMRNIWLRYDSLTGPGLKPAVIQPASATVNLWDPTLPLYEPNPGFYVFEKHLRTVRFFDNDDFRSYTGGQDIVRTGKLYYEDPRTADAVHCNVETTDGAVLTSKVQAISVKSGEVRSNVSCTFTLPPVEKLTRLNLVRRFYRDGQPCSADVVQIAVFPTSEKLWQNVCEGRIAVVGAAQLSDYLRSKGLKVETPDAKALKTLKQLKEYRLVIADTLGSLPQQSAIAEYVADGGKLLLTGVVMQSRPDTAPAYHSALLPLNGGVHRALAGLNQQDISYMRGGAASSKLALPDGKSNYRVILAGDKNGDGAALYEEFCGKGLIVHSGVNISEKPDSEPVATALLASLIRYADAYKPLDAPQRCALLAEDAVANYLLNDVGLQAERLMLDNASLSLSGFRTLVIDGGSRSVATRLLGEANTKAVREFTSRGGRIMFTALDTLTAQMYREITGKAIRLTDPYLGERTHCVKAAVCWTLRGTPTEPVEYFDRVMVPQPFERNYSPLISGLSNRDLWWDGRRMFNCGIELEGIDPVMLSDDYCILISNWRNDQTRPDYGGEYIHESKDIRRAYWFINRDPVLFSLREGKGFYLFNQLLNDDTPASLRVMRQLLTNLGCAVGGDNRLPSDSDTYDDLAAQSLQKERFAEVRRLLTPVTRSYYGTPEALKPLIISSFQKEPSKPTVLLLGNETLMQLAPAVKERMGENYSVTWNTAPIGASDTIAATIEPYLAAKDKQPDLIMVAIGEKDVLSGVAPARYAANVEAILKRLSETKAKLYIVTLPPVPTGSVEGGDAKLPPLFNEAAKKSADSYDVYLFDMYDFINRKYPAWQQGASQRFPEEMKRALGRQLAEALISFGAQVVQ
jgi:hypothetical protein